MVKVGMGEKFCSLSALRIVELSRWLATQRPEFGGHSVEVLSAQIVNV